MAVINQRRHPNRAQPERLESLEHPERLELLHRHPNRAHPEHLEHPEHLGQLGQLERLELLRQHRSREHLEHLERPEQPEQLERPERLRQNQLRGIERLAGLGVMFVVYHPGTGHLTIPLAEIGRYQDDPEAFVADKCLVSPEHYRDWLAHYQQPTCSARLPSGERCAMPIDRIDTPSRFVRGESSCCARHQAKVRAARAAG